MTLPEMPTMNATTSTEPAPHEDLVPWVRDQAREGCTRLILEHLEQPIHAHLSEQIARTWTLDDETDAARLAEQILQTATSEGKLFAGPTLYGVFAQLPGRTDHVNRMLLRVEGTREEAKAESLCEEPPESPDARGMVSQMLRHTELSARIALSQTLEIVEHYKGIVQRQSARIAALEAERPGSGATPRASSRRNTPAVPGRRRAARRAR
jgi:hypothetical protein